MTDLKNINLDIKRRGEQMKNKNFKLIKDGFIFEYDDIFGYIHVNNETTDECEDCIEIGLGVLQEQSSFECICNKWLRCRREKRIFNHPY